MEDSELEKITFKVSVEDKKTIDNSAREAGLSRSDYIRQRLLNGSTVSLKTPQLSSYRRIQSCYCKSFCSACSERTKPSINWRNAAEHHATVYSGLHHEHRNRRILY